MSKEYMLTAHYEDGDYDILGYFITELDAEIYLSSTGYGSWFFKIEKIYRRSSE